MVLDDLGGDHGVREAALVGQQLEDRDLTFAVPLEAWQHFGDAVAVAQHAVLDERPDGGGGDHLGVGVEQEQRVVGGGCRRVHAGGTETAAQRQLAVAGDGDLRARIDAGGDAAFDGGTEQIEPPRVETECRGVGGLQRRGGCLEIHGTLLCT